MEVRQQVTELSGSSLLPVHIDLKGLCYELRVEVEQSHGEFVLRRELPLGLEDELKVAEVLRGVRVRIVRELHTHRCELNTEVAQSSLESGGNAFQPANVLAGVHLGAAGHFGAAHGEFNGLRRRLVI